MGYSGYDGKLTREFRGGEDREFPTQNECESLLHG